MRNARSPFDDQAKPVAPCGNAVANPTALRSTTTDPSAASTASSGLAGDAARRPRPTLIAGPLAWVPCRSTMRSRPWFTYAIRSAPIQTGARSGTPSSVAIVTCGAPCRSQTSRFAWFPGTTRQAAKRPPDGAIAGKLPPGMRMRIGVPSELINQTSVVAFSAGEPDGVALVEGLDSKPGPG